MKETWKPYKAVTVREYSDQFGHQLYIENGVVRILHPVFDTRWFNFNGYILGNVDLRFGRGPGKIIGDE